ncbi:methyl-accepting chemotaxis protein [Amphibacillus sp. Q70]|uniref:methyl-accepting chemotaxis protein n=1 Tax=Amphibacillus sp. Q70 TaxID=3453416 RepID=UPI003F83D6A3
MKIKKLLKVSSLLVFIAIIASVLSMVGLNYAVDEEREVTETQLELERQANMLQAASDYLTEQIQNYVQYGEAKYANDYWHEVNEVQRREQAIARLEELGVSDSHFQILEQAQSESNGLVEVEEEAMHLVEENDFEQARALIFGDGYGSVKEEITRLTTEFIEAIEEEASSQVNNATRMSQMWMLISYGAIIILITVIVITFISLGRKVKGLVLITDKLKELATNDGDLTSHVDIESKDEIGEIAESFNTFVQKVRRIVVGLAEVSEVVAASSEELTATTDETAHAATDVARVMGEISDGADSQAAETAKGAEDIQYLGEQIEFNRQVLQQLNDQSTQMNQMVDTGLKAVDQLNQSADENEAISTQVADTITETDQSVKAIAKASDMILNIAEQTNLLALNAAIEASRAGESGKGFAVVADEIRKLAEDSRNFTDEIMKVINTLTTKTEGAVQLMVQAKDVVQLQTNSVAQMTTQFNTINDAIDMMKSYVKDLNTSSKKMDRQKETVVSVISNLSAISEENAAGTEEVASTVEELNASVEEIANASEALSKQAEEIQSNVNQFKY